MISAGTLTASADSKVIVDPAQEGAPSQETALSVDTKITFTSTGVQIENGGDTRAFKYADIHIVCNRNRTRCQIRPAHQSGGDGT